jgi:cell division protein ZapA
MSNLTLKIGGFDYTVACADGEEAHVTALGTLIADKLAAMPGNIALSETRALLFAALLLADEVHELRVAAATPAPAPGTPSPDELAGGLEAIALRLENIAAHLEQRPTSA